MTLALLQGSDLLSDSALSPGTDRSRDVWTLSPRHEDSLSHEYLSTGELRWVARVEVPKRGGALMVEGTGSEPEWLREVLESIAELLSLDRGWDSYDSSPIDPDAAVEVVRILLDLARTIDLELPAIVPTARGGLQLEWQLPGVFVELEVSPGVQASYFVEYTQLEREAEGIVPRWLEPLRTALSAS